MAVSIADHNLRITDFVVTNQDAVEYFSRIPEEEVETKLRHAIELGVFALVRAGQAQETDFVKREIEGLLNRVKETTGAIPSDILAQLSQQIGSPEGNVLRPFNHAVDAATKVLMGRISEVQKMLSDDINPAQETSTLGRALRGLKDLLDPARKDSVQGVLQAALGEVSSEGGALSKTVKSVVDASLKPLADEVRRLTEQAKADQAVGDVLQKSPAKGRTFEDDVVEFLQLRFGRQGAEIEHVGTDNKPGDVVVRFAEPQLGIVVEARDRGQPKGRKAITDDMAAATATRGMDAGVYVSRMAEGLAKEIGDWAEGTCERGPWVAVTYENLGVAIRFLTVLKRLKQLTETRAEIDVSGLQSQVNRIRTSLARLRTIKTKSTDVRTAAEGIDHEADELRRDITDALQQIELSLVTTTTSEVA